MKVTVTPAPVPTPPPATVTIEMTMLEAQRLAAVLYYVEKASGPDILYRRLERLGIQRDETDMHVREDGFRSFRIVQRDR